MNSVSSDLMKVMEIIDENKISFKENDYLEISNTLMKVWKNNSEEEMEKLHERIDILTTENEEEMEQLQEQIDILTTEKEEREENFRFLTSMYQSVVLRADKKLTKLEKENEKLKQKIQLLEDTSLDSIVLGRYEKIFTGTNRCKHVIKGGKFKGKTCGLNTEGISLCKHHSKQIKFGL